MILTLIVKGIVIVIITRINNTFILFTIPTVLPRTPVTHLLSRSYSTRTGLRRITLYLLRHFTLRLSGLDPTFHAWRYLLSTLFLPGLEESTLSLILRLFTHQFRGFAPLRLHGNPSESNFLLQLKLLSLPPPHRLVPSRV